MSEIAELNKLCIICLNTKTLTPIPQLKYQEVPAQTLLKNLTLIKFENEDTNRCLCRKCCKLLYSFYCMQKQFCESQKTFEMLLKTAPNIKNVQIPKTNKPDPNECIDCVCSNVTALNLPTICRICFQQADIHQIGNIIIEGKSAIELYEEFSNQNIQPDEMLCLTCLDQLFDICKFRNKFENHDFIVQNIQTEQINVKLEPDQTNYSEVIENKIEIVPNELINELTQTNTLKIKRLNKRKQGTRDDSLTYKIVCRHCPLTFDTKAEFTQHKFETKTHTFFCTKIECGICKRLLRKASEHKTHVDTIHRRLQPFECKTCLRRFSLKENLKRHMHSMHNAGKAERRVMCDRCGAKFSDTTSLKEHTQRYHDAANENYMCETCGRVLPTLRSFRVHLKIHAAASGVKKRRFVCETCGAAFSRKSALSSHKLTHGERRHVCVVCGKGFHRKRGLCKHMQSHTEDNN